MAAFNITADPQMGDYVSLSPDSLRRQRIDVLAEKIFANMTPAQTYKLGQQRGGPDTSAGRGDSSRTIALKQAIAQEKQEQQEKPDFDALDRAQGRVVAEPGISLPTAPEPTIESETVKPTATGLTGDQLTQRILDQEARLAEEEASGPPLPTAAAPTVEPGTVKPTLQAVNESPLEQPRGLRLPPSEGLLKALSKASMPPSVQPESTSTPSTANLYQTKPLETDYGTMDWRSQKDPITPEQAKQLIGEEEAQQITEEDAFSSPIDPLATAPREDEMISRYESARGPAADPYSLEPAPETATPAPETATPEPSFLSRLGSGMRDNPELLAQIAQAGGGFMQDIAQGRAQKKADARTRGAMAQSNLIGALTGGKSRPAVMREEAEQGGLLARLGQAVEAGGSVAGGEMKRRTALSQRGEEMGLERDKVENAAKRLQVDLSQAEAQKAYQGRMLELQKLGISNDLLIARAKAGKKDQPPQKVYDAYLAANSVMSTVSTVEELMKDAGLLQAGTGLMLVRGIGLEQGLPQSLGGDKTREITAAVNRMVQTLGEDMSGILSNQDIVFLKQQAPSDEDSMSTVIKKADLIRKRVADSIRDRAGVDADYFDMEPFGDLIDSVAAQGEQAPGDLAEKLGQTEIKLP